MNRIPVTLEQIQAARIEVEALTSAGIDPDPLVVQLAQLRPKVKLLAPDDMAEAIDSFTILLENHSDTLKHALQVHIRDRSVDDVTGRTDQSALWSEERAYVSEQSSLTYEASVPLPEGESEFVFKGVSELVFDGNYDQVVQGEIEAVVRVKGDTSGTGKHYAIVEIDEPDPLENAITGKKRRSVTEKFEDNLVHDEDLEINY